MTEIIKFPETKKPDFEIYKRAVRKINSILEMWGPDLQNTPSLAKEELPVSDLDRSLKDHEKLLELLNKKIKGEEINGKNVLFSSFGKIDIFFQNIQEEPEVFSRNKKFLESFFPDSENLEDFIDKAVKLSGILKYRVEKNIDKLDKDEKEFISLYWIKLLSRFADQKYGFDINPVFKSLIIKDFLDKFQVLGKDLDIFKKWAKKDPYIFGELSRARGEKEHWAKNASFFYKESETLLFKGDVDQNIAYMEYLLNNPEYFNEVIDCL